MKPKTLLYLLVSATLMAGCTDKEPETDAYGNFEATEVTVSADAAGTLSAFNVEEDQLLAANQTVGYIDTVQLSLKRAQLVANREAIRSRVTGVNEQVDVLQVQYQNAVRERDRTAALYAERAATQKQLDDMSGQVRVLAEQIEHARTPNQTTEQEVRSLNAQIAQIDDQIRRSRIVNPTSGTVLNTFVEAHELVAPGKPLYKIADLSTLYLRAYMTGDQLPRVRLGQAVSVLVDNGNQELRTMKGTVTWISSKAEFTPKTIQTREERVNQVYAFKVRVGNPDRRLKIGMPGEVRFTTAGEKK